MKIGDKIFFKCVGLLSLALVYLLPIYVIYSLIDYYINPPSEIYGERQILDEWRTKCLDEDCYHVINKLKTRASLISNIGSPNEDYEDVLALIEADEDFAEGLTIELRDWETGEELSTYPQEEHKWYQLFKKYDSYESVVRLIDYESLDTVGYEAQFSKDCILITQESCDSRGFETQENIYGGCFLLSMFASNLEYEHTLSLELKDGRVVLIEL